MLMGRQRAKHSSRFVLRCPFVCRQLSWGPICVGVGVDAERSGGRRAIAVCDTCGNDDDVAPVQGICRAWADRPRATFESIACAAFEVAAGLYAPRLYGT